MAGGLGALAVVAVMALSSVASAGVAHPGSFPGAYWAPYTYRDNSGCATAHAFPAHWSALTGDGKSRGSASAKTCPAYRGGTSIDSSGYVDQELDVYAPVSLPSGTGGVNVTWNLHMVASTSSGLSGSNYACPPTNYSYSYWFGYTWWNITETYGYCEVGSDLFLGGEAYLYDMTSGSYFYPSNYWEAYNESFVENYSYNVSETYSNSSYWAYNYTYSYGYNGSYNYGYGVLSAGSYSGAVSPQWFINGTYSSTDKYVVEAYIYGDMDTYVEGFSGTGHASASINMATGANHEDLAPFSVW